jgi:hypothetical protein
MWFQPIQGQDSTGKEPVWALSGYLKDMISVQYNELAEKTLATNLVHNRINLKWDPENAWSGRFELRTRLFWGDDVSSQPYLKQQLRNANEAVDLSAAWQPSRSSLLITNVDRIWVEYKSKKWSSRIGRQRVNWGINNIWNPNDLFNTYNFLDFDYEERPGCDAVKGQYFINDLSNIEVVASAADTKTIIAAKYFTNFRNYDLQWNSGLYLNTFTAGFGWAGSIKDAGFKGELQFYARNEEVPSQVLVSAEGDYSFKKGWYVSSGLLFNQRGLDHPLTDSGELVLTLTPRNLMPTKWNFLVSASKEFTPIVSGTLSMIYAPGTNLLIIYPSLRYNVATNWDLDLVWQSFFAETTSFQALSHTGFFRVRWSF